MAIVFSMLAAGFWHFATTDYSLRQNEQRRKLGAVYMTLNNPFYEVIDEEIRTTVENHGDILISIAIDLLKNSSGGKIALLKHSQARS